ncbi:MAG: Gfo/Idh/MocA family oxidoreductase [Variovorax sp.]
MPSQAGDDAQAGGRPLRVGVVGLGRAFTVMLPTFTQDVRVKLVAAADPIEAARTQFTRDFEAPAYADAEALCADARVEAVYVASPHQFHAEHVCLAASYGKHVLVEKPMALTLDECSRMIDAASKAKVHLVVGHSHSFDAPIARTRQLIASGSYGDVRMITALNFTDFLYRPRRPEELNTAAGGGVIHSQATHQIDIVRLLGGGLVRNVRAHTGQWDEERPTEGAYSALLEFESGAFASATYSGYGRYDSDALMDHIGEMGQKKNPHEYGAARKRLVEAAKAADAPGEAALKAARNYGGSLYAAGPEPNADLAHQHFGHIVVCCDKADLRPTAHGVEIYADEARSFDALPSPVIVRREVIDEWLHAVRSDVPPVHGGEWARATTEVCLSILESAQSRSAVPMRMQEPTRDTELVRE